MVCLRGTWSLKAELPRQSDSATGFSLLQPWRDLRIAWVNKNFRQTIGTKLSFGAAAGTYTALGLYLGTYFWEFSADQLALLVAPMFLGTVFAFAILGHIGKRVDKPRMISSICLIFTVNSIWFVAARLLHWLPDNGHPLILLLQMLQIMVAVFCVAGLQMLGASLLADILDEQEVKIGQRQEGVFFAASAFVYKATTGLGTLVAGLVIDASGLQAGAEPGTVPETVLAALGGFSVLIYTLCGLGAWLFALRVRLSRDKLHRIQSELGRASTVNSVS